MKDFPRSSWDENINETSDAVDGMEENVQVNSRVIFEEIGFDNNWKKGRINEFFESLTDLKYGFTYICEELPSIWLRSIGRLRKTWCWEPMRFDKVYSLNLLYDL